MNSEHRTAQQIFVEVLPLAGPDQEAALVRLCANDAGTLDQVRQLLFVHKQTGELGRLATIEDDRRDIPVTLEQASGEESPGSRIGPYRLLQQIGEGGFGSVFLAEQERPVRRKVALKIIKLGMDTRHVVARFEQERQALAMMDHPNIAKVFDAGATNAGRPYFVMELCKGEPITAYCDKNKLSIPDRLELFVQVCHAVQHAHQKGLIHRDIKPSNILVSSNDDGVSAKVIDFGIAKATATKLTEMTLFTRQEQMVGTPEYMSPEQAEGSFDIDTRTDVYALGVVLYELLTGSTPVDAKKLRAIGFAEIQRIIRQVEPPIPSTRVSRSSESLEVIATQRHTEPKKLGSIIRGELDWIVMKALDKDRQRRYETANGLALDVQRFLAGDAVVAAPPGAAYRVRKFLTRNRGWVAAGGAVAIALLIGVVAFAWQAKLAEDARDNAVKAKNSEVLLRESAEKDRAEATIAADNAERAAYQAQMVSAASAVQDQRMDAAGALLNATAPRLRGWEYRHLQSRLDRSLPSPFPADWKISAVSASANSANVAVLRAIGDRPAEWVVPDHDTPDHAVRGAEHERVGVVLSPDGKRAVWAPPTADDPRAIKLWSTDNRTVLATIPAQPAADNEFSSSASWSQSGDRFIIANGRVLEVHDGATGALILRKESPGWAHFTEDSRYIFLNGSRPGQLFDGRAYQLLDARTLDPVTEVSHFEAPIAGGAVAFSRSRIACSLEDGTLRLLEIVDGKLRERSKIPGGIGVLHAPVWSGDGRFVAVGSHTGRLRVWEAATNLLVGDFAGPQIPISGLMFLRESGDLFTCDEKGNQRVWPVGSSTSTVLTAHRSFVYPAVISKDGGMLLTGGWDGESGFTGGLKLWDARTGTLVAEYGRKGEIIQSADLSPDGRYAVVGIMAEIESDRRTEVIDLASGAVVATFKAPAKQDQAIFTIVHPDGRRVVSSYPYGEAYVWDILTGKILWQTNLDGDPSGPDWLHSSAVAVSPDGHLFAFSNSAVGIRLIDADTYTEIRRWDAHKEAVWSLSFSPDGKWLLSSSSDHTVGVWEVATGKLIARLVGHNADVLCAAMSPDGTRIASGGRDGIVRLWDTTHFENVAQLGGHKDYIYSLAWSPDGRQLISSSGDSTVRIWDTRTLAEQLSASRARSDALPGIEAKIAKANNDAKAPPATVEAIIASPNLSAREHELARQIAARFAFRGTPAYYRAARTKTPIVIDGKIDESVWKTAPWSTPFVDIEGDTNPRPRFETRMRMLWDDKYLYIAARIEEPHVSATLKVRDDIVFRDNDFEVFLDPAGTARWYSEVEVNALATIFDLQLDRPYTEGGTPHFEWSPPDLKAAVSIDGTLNDASDTDRGWTVEIAIPHQSLAEHGTVPLPPRPGDVWRINFSRVEWLYDIVDGHYVKRPNTKEDNWVWTPQHAINMHIPREWGFVEFAGDSP